MSADAIIAAVRKRGNDATTLRDAAHEACHAIQARIVRGKWDREAIHHKLTKGLSNAELVRVEIVARAVEQLVCRDLGVDCGSVEEWANITWWETAKNMRIQLPDPKWIADCVHKSMGHDSARKLADKVIALGGRP